MLSTVTRTRKDPGEWLACLREHGICVIPAYYDRAFVEAIRAACVERGTAPGDVNFPDGSYKRFDVYQGTAAAANERIYHADCFSPEAAAFRRDSLLAQVGGDYHGGPQSVHVCMYERHRRHDVPVRGFHVDTFECSTYKVMLYLGDVTDRDGPTSYMPGTHRDAELRRRKQFEWGPAVSPGDPSGAPHPTNFRDEELGPERLARHTLVTGPAGTAILFDTWGVHKGTSPQAGGDRHVLVNYYRAGADLPRSHFGFDAGADYRRYAGDDYWQRVTGAPAPR